MAELGIDARTITQLVEQPLDPAEPPPRGGETSQTVAFLTYLRGAIVGKLEGLDEADLRRGVLPSGWSLLGLVRHLAYVERFWRSRIVDGEPVELPWTEDDPDADWRVDEGTSPEEILDLYRREATATNHRFLGAALDAPVADPEAPFDLRWVLLHLVEETARHAGHADAARELLDGVTRE